jgi:hypothetical protein
MPNVEINCYILTAGRFAARFFSLVTISVLSRRCVPSSGSVNPVKMQNCESTPTGSAILTRFCPAIGAKEGYGTHEQNIRNGLVFRHCYLRCPKRFVKLVAGRARRSLVLSYREHLRFALCIHRDFEPAGFRTGGGYWRPALHLWESFVCGCGATSGWRRPLPTPSGCWEMR